MENNQIEDTIRVRNNWLKLLIWIGTFSVISYKIITWPPITIAADFKFIDLLSMILAIFSIILSALFYFKANETASTFYDNTYKFTKDISEILGRIEERFGERLKHLDEGYSGLRDRVERYSTPAPDVSGKVAKETAGITKIENEKEMLLRELLEKAKIEEKKREAILSQLRDKDQALLAAQRQLDLLQNQSKKGKSQKLDILKKVVHDFFRDTVLPDMEEKAGKEIHADNLRREFAKFRSDFPTDLLRDMRTLGYLDKAGHLTNHGITALMKDAL